MSARVTNAQVMEAILGLAARVEAVEAGAPAKKAGAKGKAQPKAEEKRSYLSCWASARVNPDAKGVFKHTNRKTQEVKSYRALTREQAHAELDAQMDAGRTFALPA